MKIYCSDKTPPDPLFSPDKEKERLNLLQEFFDQESLIPYEQDLRQPIEPGSSTTWWDLLQSYANSNIVPETTDLNFLCCYIFISALYDLPEKHLEIASALDELSKEQMQQFFEKLLTLPPLMGAYIFHLTPDNAWGSIFYKAQANYSVIIKWIETALKHLPQEKAKSFVLTIFRSYASEDFLRCYVTEASHETQQFITNTLTPAENRTCLRIKYELEVSTQTFFANTQKRHCVFLPRSLYERRYILQQAALFDTKNKLQYHSIIPNLSISDWQWFYSQIPSERLLDFPYIIINSAVKIRSLNGSLDFLSLLPSFLPEKILLTVCRLLGDQEFFSELSSHLSAFQDKSIPYFAQSEPYLLNAWIEYLLKTTKPVDISSKIHLLLEPLIKRNNWDSFLPTLFAKHSFKPTYALTVYASLPSHARKILLKYLSKYNPPILIDWILLLISPFATRPIDPFVRHSALQDLYILLKELHPSLPLKLRKHIESRLPPETKHLVDLYLPTHIDLSNTEELQNISLQKCIRYFSDPLIEQYSRYAWTHDILLPFTANLPTDSWIETLIQNISQERWPILFRVFRMEIMDIFRSQKNTNMDVWIKRTACTLQQITKLSLNTEESQKHTKDLLTSIDIHETNDLALLIEHLKNPPHLFLPSLSLLYTYYSHKNNVEHWNNFSTALDHSFLIEHLLFYSVSEKSNIEQFFWNEITKIWRAQTPDREFFYVLVEKINNFQGSSRAVNKDLLNRLCETFLKVECNPLKWLENRPNLLEAIKKWYPFEEASQLESLSLFSIGLLDLLNPDLLTSSLERRIPFWNLDTLENLLEILEELHLVEKHLSTPCRSFLSKLSTIDLSTYPTLKRTCEHLRTQRPTPRPCIIS